MPKHNDHMSPPPKKHFGVEWENATVEKVADVNVYAEDDEDFHRTALHCAASWCEDVNVIRQLIDKGADVNYTDKADYTPLHWAAKYNKNHKVTELLICHEAYVKAESIHEETILHCAAKNKNPKVAEILIGHDLDVNATDEGIDTPLHKAAWDDNHNVAALLIDHEAHVNAKNKSGYVPLHYAAIKDFILTAKVLICGSAKQSVNLNEKNGFGHTPLHEAVIHNSQSVVELLVKHKADALKKTMGGQIALELGEKNELFQNSNAYQSLKKETDRQKAAMRPSAG